MTDVVDKVRLYVVLLFLIRRLKLSAQLISILVRLGIDINISNH
jgi:hypothetical protein